MKYLPLVLTSTFLVASTPIKDPFFANQWGLHNDGSPSVRIEINDRLSLKQNGKEGMDIGWTEAQSLLQNRPQTPVIVAVIDSGIDEGHPDLAGRVLTDGKNFLDESKPPIDDIGHGTHISGIIAANTQNGIGISGVASPLIKILPLKVLGNEYIYQYPFKTVSTFTATAVRYAVAHHASVINLSLGWPSYSDSSDARDAVREAVDAGVIVIAAAGNNRKNKPTYPCSYEGVLCVGAVTNTGDSTHYSDFGGRVDLLAPGDDIISLFPHTLDSGNLRIRGYEQMSGTSQAAPHVAGIAATLKSIFPNLSANELKVKILASTLPLPNENTSLYGLVNLKRAIEATPRPVWIPQFKILGSESIDESSLQIQNAIPIQNLGSPAKQVKLEVYIHGALSGSLLKAEFATDETIYVPWKYTFKSMDESSDLQMKVKIVDASQVPVTFSNEFSVVRQMDRVKDQMVASLSPQQTGIPMSWFEEKNGRTLFKLKDYRARIYGASNIGVPYFYQQIQSPDGVKDASLILIDSSKTNGATLVRVPNVNSGIGEVIRIDANQDGKMDWVILGLGNDSAGDFLQFYFLDSHFKPLFGNHSAWRINIIPPYRSAVVHSYATPGSWILHEGRLVPAGISESILLPEEQFKGIDVRNMMYQKHLFYLAPQADSSLKLKMVDGLAFQKTNPDLVLQGFAPMTLEEQKNGHLRVLTSMGKELDSEIQFWEVNDTAHADFREAKGWNLLSFAGKDMKTIPENHTVYTLFSDKTRGNLTWTDEQPLIRKISDFKFDDFLNPIVDLTGAFEIPHLGRFWFVQTQFSIVGFDGKKTKPLSIESDSSFSTDETRDMFSPVLAGTQANPLPGIYIDSTPVQGNQVSIAVWDSQNDAFHRSIRYSLEIPRFCTQLPPTQLNDRLESLSFPLLCRRNENMEFHFILPSVHP